MILSVPHCKKIILSLLVTFCLSDVTSAQNFLFNGDFENGASGNGFQTPGPYNYLSTLSGTSTAGDYAVIADPFPMNTAYFIHSSDHSGTGKMMVIDGTTTGGQQRFWKAGSSGGGVGGLTVGLTYTFSYWVRSVSTSVTDVFTSADIGVQFNNASGVALTYGSTQVPFNSAVGWVQVKYTFVATNAYVNIEMYNNNTSGVGNDFALDDIEVLGPPSPLSVSYSLSNTTCPGGNDGFIIAYGVGGTKPYTYSFDGGVYSSNNILSSLSASSHNVTVKDATLTTVSGGIITISSATNPLTAAATVNPLCYNSNTTLQSSGASSYNWSAIPTDTSLHNVTSNNTVVKPLATTTYTVSSNNNSNVNLIYNGDFSLGNVGFINDYTYKTTNPTGTQHCYGVMPNAQIFYNTFSACGDHSTGSGNMLVVDGSLNSGDRIWSQTIVVKPSTTYTFSYWIQSLTVNNPAQIVTKINGTAITGTPSTNPANAPATIACGNWQQVTYNWTSGVGITSATITLNDLNMNANGNDFAIDDISFAGSYSCSLSKSITVVVSSPPTTQNINVFGCGGATTYNGNTYTSSTIFKDTVKSVSTGCDSIYKNVNINVNGLTTTTTTITKSGCNQVVHNSHTYTSSTLLRDTLKSYQGCDSVYIVTNIVVTPINAVTNTITKNGCNQVVYNSNTYTSSTVLRDTLKSYQGCDSIYNIVNIVLTPVNAVTNTVTKSGCNKVIYNSVTYSSSTVLRDTVKSYQGCDSIYNVVNIVVTPITTLTNLITKSGCNSVIYNSVTYIISTVLRDTIKSYQGCDSIYNIINIVVNGVNIQTNNILQTGCNKVVYNSIAYTSSTILRDTIKSYQGCDSVYNVISVVITPITATTINITKNGCNSLVYNSVTYTSSTILRDTIKSYQGCDSIYNIVNIVITPITATTNTITKSGCNEVVYNGVTYTSSTILRDTIKSYQGCDSVYNTVNIVITPITATTNTIMKSGCNKVVYNGVTYTSSTILRDTIKSYQGCDSIYNIVNIVITPITATTINITKNGCNSLVYNSVTYTSSTILRDTIKSYQGCDSIYNIVNIVITPITATTNTITKSGCNKIVYNSVTYTSSTILRDTIKSYQGCDSVYNVVSIVITPITATTNTITKSSCNEVVYNGVTYTGSTILRDTIKTYQGCDSIYNVINISVNTITPINQLQTIKGCSIVAYNGNTYNNSTVLKDTIKSYQGCDSIYKIVTITVNTPPAKPTVANINQPDCQNPLGSFLVTNPLGINYVYSNDGVTYQTLPLFTNLITKTYSVLVKDTSSGCISVATPAIISAITQQPIATINYGSNSFYLVGSATPQITSAFSIQSGIFSAQPNGLVLNNITGVIDLQNSDTGKYEISFNFISGVCSGLATTTITVKHFGGTVKIPNVFSPNGDGINDTWDIENMEYFPFATISIFDRYGRLLKTSRSKKKIWDGTYNNLPVAVGTYYWVMTLKPDDKSISGTITVLR